VTANLLKNFTESSMRRKDDRRIENFEDRRRIRPAQIVIGGGIVALILGTVAMFRGAEPRPLVDLPRNHPQAVAPPASPPADPQPDPLKDFVSVILGDTENVWHELFKKMNREYKEPRLVLFTGQVQTACGFARAAIGPLYCPSDEKIYIDLSFFQEMKDRYHAPGDFGRAYVIAHEVGHHVQNLLGTGEKVRARQRKLSDVEASQLSVRLELQADFLAGAWAHHADRARHILEPGDLEAALKAVAALGDDRHGPEQERDAVTGSFTRCWDGRHGTAEQRARWFSRGLKTGDLTQGDTIEVDEL
jgi:predicted metalloprotease